MLENNVVALKEAQDAHRSETRAGFADIKLALDRLFSDVAQRASPTNWFAVIGAAASAIVIIGAVFALAEWRVTAVSDPLQKSLVETRAAVEKQQSQISDLRVQLGVERALRTHTVPGAH